LSKQDQSDATEAYNQMKTEYESNPDQFIKDMEAMGGDDNGNNSENGDDSDDSGYQSKER